MRQRQRRMLRRRMLRLRLNMRLLRRNGQAEAPMEPSDLDRRAHRTVDRVETPTGRELLAAPMRTVADREPTQIVADRVETPTAAAPAVMRTDLGKRAATPTVRDKLAGTRWDRRVETGPDSRAGIDRGRPLGTDPGAPEAMPTGISQLAARPLP
jgi:hypothetical protein